MKSSIKACKGYPYFHREDKVKITPEGKEVTINDWVKAQVSAGNVTPEDEAVKAELAKEHEKKVAKDIADRAAKAKLLAEAKAQRRARASGKIIKKVEDKAQIAKSKDLVKELESLIAKIDKESRDTLVKLFGSTGLYGSREDFNAKTIIKLKDEPSNVALYEEVRGIKNKLKDAYEAEIAAEDKAKKEKAEIAAEDKAKKEKAEIAAEDKAKKEKAKFSSLVKDAKAALYNLPKLTAEEITGYKKDLDNAKTLLDINTVKTVAKNLSDDRVEAEAKDKPKT